MSTVSKTKTEQALDAALKDCEVYVYRSTVAFDDEGNVLDKKKAYRLSEVRDQFVERENFESDAVGVYRSVKSGVVTRIIAGTGVGKSTRMPVAISVAVGCIGIVLCPYITMASVLATYVASNIQGSKYEACMVRLVKSYKEFLELKKPAVAFMGASEFLAMFSTHSMLFKERNVGYMCMDESHERIPAYSVCRMLATVGMFSDTKILMGSATASQQSLETRAGDVRQSVRKVKPVDMVYDDPASISSKSPLYHAYLRGRTLVFLPTETCFGVLYDYYESNAVHCRTVSTNATRRDIESLNEFLADVSYTVVVLATPIHQSTYTFEVDTEIDCGVTAYLDISVDNGDIVKRDRVVTEFERVQRAGRVGRHMDGVAFYVDADVCDDNFELYAGAEVYISLWCKVFNIDISLPYLKFWNSKLSDVSLACARVLLCSRVHPALLLYYLEPNGDVYSGTRSLFPKILGRTQAVNSSSRSVSTELTDHWLSRTYIADHPFGNVTDEFKVPVQVPVEWYPLAFLLWHALNGVSMNEYVRNGDVVRRVSRVHSDTGSIFSFAMTDSTILSTLPVLGEGSAVARRAALGPGRSVRPGSTGSVRSWVESVALPEGETFQPVLPDGDAGKGRRKPKTVTIQEELEEVPRTITAKKSGKSSGRPRLERVVRHSAGSGLPASLVPGDGQVLDQLSVQIDNRLLGGDGGSTVLQDSNQLAALSGPLLITRPESGRFFPRARNLPSSSAVVASLAPIQARSLHHHRIRPYADALMVEFTRMRVGRAYESVYAGLRKRRVLLDGMTVSEVEEYFVATVLAWNGILSQYFQYTAAPKNGILAETTERFEKAKFQRELDIAKNFLAVFELHGHLIAMYTGVDQCGTSTPSDRLSRARVKAEYAVKIGSNAVADWIDVVKQCVQVHPVVANYGGHYFVDGKVMFLVRHVFVAGEAGEEYVRFPRSDVASMRLMRDSRVCKCVLTAGRTSSTLHRLPLIGESVVVVGYLTRNSPDIFGVYSVTSVGQTAVYDAELTGGMSGCPVVALSDGAVVGFHSGVFVDGPYAGLSEFVLSQ